ncbi:hypothetical protein BWR59_16025 [Pseudomonas sp. Bc-h]|uniref:hypothetical protein n=1 Tax=Pseudomonas sp. Bc-h TaxID=1943632 RepID=UPI0009D97F70|nr:hypothetical protein [Pseudomonas sp. Bc-h]OQR31017.1 hypothetical protein BWR59_16025 [Pseudomonas sp. Bc-h]
MRTLFKSASVAVACAVISGCGGEDFTGAYRYQESSSKGAMVLNIHGDQAELFADIVATGIKPVGKLKVSQKDGKLLLDDKNSSLRLVMKRNVDERSLDCLNCKVLGMRADELVWNYDPKGPYDVDQLLKEQARKREEALNAELEKIQKEALEKGRRDTEAQKLAPFEGDWVYQRTTKHDPLTIMGVWRSKQIRVWTFKYETMDRLSYEIPGFEVTDAGLTVGEGSSAKLYSLNSDRTIITCLSCDKATVWVRADPKKDLSDRNYARQMAGKI